MSDNPYFCPTCAAPVKFLDTAINWGKENPNAPKLSLLCPACFGQLVTWAEAVRAGMVAKSA